MTRAWCLAGEALLGQIAGARMRPGEVMAWYIGQVGFVFKGDRTVCIDPVLNDLSDERGASCRMYAPPFDGAAFQPDYVLCTHGHADHMALPTLTAMAAAGDNTRFLVPAGCAEELIAAGVAPERVIGLMAKTQTVLPGLTVTPVQAAHPVHETDAQGRDLALCLMLEMNGVRLLHLGDTYLTDQLLADLTALPRPDVMFAPINGGDYFRTARHCIGNLDSLEAARLSAMLHAGVAVPTHFDMVAGNTCDPLAFVRCLWAEDPAARCWLPALGEGRAFGRTCE